MTITKLTSATVSELYAEIENRKADLRDRIVRTRAAYLQSVQDYTSLGGEVDADLQINGVAPGVAPARKTKPTRGRRRPEVAKRESRDLLHERVVSLFKKGESMTIDEIYQQLSARGWAPKPTQSGTSRQVVTWYLGGSASFERIDRGRYRFNGVTERPTRRGGRPGMTLLDWVRSTVAVGGSATTLGLRDQLLRERPAGISLTSPHLQTSINTALHRAPDFEKIGVGTYRRLSRPRD